MEDDWDQEIVGDQHERYFRTVCGRRLNALNPRYLLPVDEDEIRRQGYFHRMLQFIFEGKNYVGPFQDVICGAKRRRPRILDLGTGGGLWACQVADEFPQADVVGVDIAPIQPLDVPRNCEFEVWDLDCAEWPYPDDYYDIIHARCMSLAVRNYPAFLREATRILHPGGLLLLVELDYQPVADGRRAPYWQGLGGDGVLAASGAPGWFALWDAYLRSTLALGFDVSVPRRLGQILHETKAYVSLQTCAQQADIPIGFCHRDQTLLTVGQLAWMDFDLFLTSIRPYLLCLFTKWQVERLIEDAQSDLYYPVMRLTTRLHVVNAVKK